VEINEYIEKNGIAKAMEKYSGIETRSDLAKLIIKIYGMLGHSSCGELIEAVQEYTFGNKCSK